MQTQLPPNRLRELRTRAVLKLYDISALLRRAPATVHPYETGNTPLPDELKIALAEHYGVTVEYLMGWDALANGEAA